MGMGCWMGGHRWETRCRWGEVITKCKDCGAEEKGTQFGGPKEHLKVRDERAVERHFNKTNKEESSITKEPSEHKTTEPITSGFGAGLIADASTFKGMGAPIKRVWITAGNMAGEMPIISAMLVDGDLFITPNYDTMPRPPAESDYAKQREAAAKHVQLKKELKELELTFPQLSAFD